VPPVAATGSTTSACCNKFHMVLRAPRKRDLGRISMTER
jgi:hypothetical protein